jgi:hypothetical protein
MAPPITMIIAAILGLAMGYTGRKWWFSGIVTGSLLTLYGIYGGSEGFVLTGIMITLFFPLFFSIGSLASIVGMSFKRWRMARSETGYINP